MAFSALRDHDEAGQPLTADQVSRSNALGLTFEEDYAFYVPRIVKL